MQVETSHIKICWACSGTGKIFGGTQPFRFAECIPCWGTGWRGKISVPPIEIKMHNIGTTSDSNAHVFSIKDFKEGALLAHVMHKAGIFPSISQARKNGWERPIEVGTWTLTKKRIRVTVTE